MQGLPRALYARIERELRADHRQAVMDAEEELARCREDAHGLKSPALDESGKTIRPANRVQDGALRVIQAEQRLDTRKSWADVARALDAAFTGTKTGEVARLLYTDGRRPAEISALLGVDRQTVRKRRDDYVIRAALLAAERGLIRMSDYAEERRQA